MNSSPAARYAMVTSDSGKQTLRPTSAVTASSARMVIIGGTSCSMRCVTRKPPAMLIVASRIAAAPRITIGDDERSAHLQHAADHDDAADRVGHAHQRRVQRRRDVPHHLPADDARQREHGEVRDRNAGGATRPRPISASAAIRRKHRNRAGAALGRLDRRARRRERPSVAARLLGIRRQRRPAARAGGGHINSPLAQDQRTAHDFVGEIEVEVAGAAHVGEQVRQVVAVEQARGRRQPARQIDVADDVHAVALARPCPARSARSCRRSPRPGRRSPSPFFIAFTMSSVMRTGAGRFGISAVVMMMSTSFACAANIAISALMNAGLISLA